MKKLLLVVVLTIVLTGCTKNQKVNAPVKLTDTGEPQLKVVTNYNQAIFTKDWENAKKLLGGQAYKSFETNVAKYKNSSNLLNQANSFETVNDQFSIVHSDVYLETFNGNKKSVLSRKSIRYFLLKDPEWKIVKVEEMQEQYSKQFGSLLDSREQSKIRQIVSDFINYSAQGKYDKASKYLTGNLLGDAEKYKIDNLPKYKVKGLNIEVIGSTADDAVVKANYSINDKNIKMIFHMVKIKDIWLIDEEIIG